MASHGKIAKTAAKAAPALTLLTNMKAITAEITRLAEQGKDYQHAVHVLACSVLKHTAKHGRVQVLENFLASMPDCVRVNSLKTWFETFGQLTFSAVEGTDDKKAKWRIDRAKKLRLADAMEKPFWKFKGMEGQPYKPLVMDDYLDHQIKRLEKDMKETGADHKAIIAAFKAAKAGTATVN